MFLAVFTQKKPVAWVAGLCLLSISCISGWAGDRVQVTLLSTTDIHGHILPWHYQSGKLEPLGMAKVASLVKQVREKQPNVLLLDCGDLIQGTPLTFYHARKTKHQPDPMALILNAMNYDAFVVGNHEFNYGLETLHKAQSESNFPWLSANTHRAGTDEPAFPAYTVKTIAGVKIGILGLTTPGIPNWENPPNYAGLEFVDPVQEARRWVRVLQEEERVDVIVALLHMGVEIPLSRWGNQDERAQSWENQSLAIARSVPGIDVVFMGHTHREVDGLFVGNTLLMQAQAHARSVARVDLYLERSESDAWEVVLRQGSTLPVTTKTAMDPEIVALAQPYHEATEAWLSQKIGQTSSTLDAGRSRLEDTALIDLIHRVQLDAAQADVSIASSFTLAAKLPEGAVTVRDLYGLYQYENTLLAVELTGAQLKEILEHSARYFLPIGPEGKPTYDPSIPGYNYDMAEGVDYVIDLSQPYGQRIRDLTFQGAPLAADQKLRVAVNNYRFNGGGDYPAYSDAPVLWQSGVEIRDLIIDWVDRHGEIPSTPTRNWCLAW
jgi:2',3'-cyclic-nucleotide 2'-phosphodiesterase / 3'-nucleotidase